MVEQRTPRRQLRGSRQLQMRKDVEVLQGILPAGVRGCMQVPQALPPKRGCVALCMNISKTHNDKHDQTSATLLLHHAAQ